MFRKFVCIYLIVYSSIGSNGPFPLPKYCALPIASLDLIVCIYCLNDFQLKKKNLNRSINDENRALKGILQFSTQIRLYFLMLLLPFGTPFHPIWFSSQCAI